MSYVTKGTVQKYLNVDIASSMDAQLDDWITAIEKWIEKYTGKSFEASSETRYYDTYNSKRGYEIDIDPFTAITALEYLDEEGATDETLTEGQSNDFLTYPLNDTEKYKILILPTSSVGPMPIGARRLKVTATFGHSDVVPKDIELVATKLVASVVSEGLKGGKLQQVNIGDYQATFEKIDQTAEALGIYQILDMYRDIEL